MGLPIVMLNQWHGWTPNINEVVSSGILCAVICKAESFAFKLYYKLARLVLQFNRHCPVGQLNEKVQM